MFKLTGRGNGLHAAKGMLFMAVRTRPALSPILEPIAMFRGKVMLLRWILVVLVVSFGSLAQADTQPMGDAVRGELLYATHCIACHSDKVHWRDKKLVTDWKSLRSEIDRWQVVSGLLWNNEDIADVARYLNALYYRYPAPD